MIELCLSNVSSYPRRLICLTEETTETIYLLGEQDRLVGISGYTVRPREARQKPRVSAFTSAKFDDIVALRPDLVLTFSDMQADISRELIARGIPVVAFNQRSIAEIFEMILTLGRLLGCVAKAEVLGQNLLDGLNAIAASADRLPFRPKVFFEEWKDPLISGIRWTEELVEIAGGTPIFPELRNASLARERIVAPEQVIPRNPDIIIASWCGTKVNKEAIRNRPGWSSVSAVQKNQIFEIKSTYILQPGPASLTEGVRQLHAIISHVCGHRVAPELAPQERCDIAVGASELT
jgi:iron complex transport system substrate-binding protein